MVSQLRSRASMNGRWPESKCKSLQLKELVGFNLKVTRFLAFIAFLMATPIVVIGYLAAVFLIPSSSSRVYDHATEKEKKQARRTPSSSATADEVRRRYQSLDKRLARLEKHVTSKRFQLEQELRRL